MQARRFRQLLGGIALMLSSMAVCAEDSRQAGFYPPLRLSTTSVHPLSTPEGTGLIDRIVTEAMQRLGRSAEIIYLPPERAILDLLHGLYDGTATRVAGLEVRYPSLVPVPYSFLTLDFVIFTKRRDVVVHRWDDLKDYNIAYIGGWKLPEQSIRSAQSITRVKNMEQLFGLLERDRVDLIIFARKMGVSYIKRSHISGIHLLAPALESKPMYIYLHQRHQSLVTPLVEVLGEMDAEGWIGEVKQQILEPLNSLQRLLQ